MVTWAPTEDEVDKWTKSLNDMTHQLQMTKSQIDDCRLRRVCEKFIRAWTDLEILCSRNTDMMMRPMQTQQLMHAATTS